MSFTVKERSIIIALLRRASLRWLARFEVIKESRVDRGKYMCVKCKQQVGSRDFHIDHKKPVIPVTGFDDWNGFIERLFCNKTGLQLLCKPCHKLKSNKENKKR